MISQAYKCRVTGTSRGLQSLSRGVHHEHNWIDATPFTSASGGSSKHRDESQMFNMEAKYQGNITESSPY